MKALRFKQMNVARQSGELARIRVIKGPDAGTVFVLSGSRISIGRGEDNDVVLGDLRASRHHAEIVLSGDNWSIRDTGSQNGILCNGAATRAANLNGKDIVTLGETTFEFIASNTSNTRSIVAPMPVLRQGTSTGITSPSNGGAPGLPSTGTRGSSFNATSALGPGGLQYTSPGVGGTSVRNKLPPAQPAKKANSAGLFGIAAVIVALLFMLSGNERRSTKETAREPASALRLPVDAESRMPAGPRGGSSASQALRSADQFFKIGLREYKAGNFARAKVQFETALQVFPGHPLALRYTSMCDQEIEELVSKLLQDGRKQRDLGRVKASRAQYEAILRLLATHTTDPGYLQAKEELKTLDASRDIAGGGN